MMKSLLDITTLAEISVKITCFAPLLIKELQIRKDSEVDKL